MQHHSACASPVESAAGALQEWGAQPTTNRPPPTPSASDCSSMPSRAASASSMRFSASSRRPFWLGVGSGVLNRPCSSSNEPHQPRRIGRRRHSGRAAGGSCREGGDTHLARPDAPLLWRRRRTLVEFGGTRNSCHAEGSELPSAALPAAGWGIGPQVQQLRGTHCRLLLHRRCVFHFGSCYWLSALWSARLDAVVSLDTLRCVEQCRETSTYEQERQVPARRSSICILRQCSPFLQSESVQSALHTYSAALRTVAREYEGLASKLGDARTPRPPSTGVNRDWCQRRHR